MSKEQLPTVEALAPLARLLASRFIQRRDLHARQTSQGYRSVKAPLTEDHLVAHLRGSITLGAYVLDADSNGRYLVLDADDDPDWRRLRAIARILANEGAASYLEASRRGGHLWFFLPYPRPGAQIRAFGLGLLAHFGDVEMELFPKQARLTSGPGSMIRLPFGIHHKSGRRYGFYTPDGEPVAPTLREQIVALSAAETVPDDVFSRFAAIAPPAAPEPVYKPSRWAEEPLTEAEGATLSRRIKAAIPVRDFVFQFVQLSPRGLGQCPFHDDQVESFSVNDQENYWHCFACGTGGSIIDFWMQWQRCDFKTAVTDLAQMVLDGNWG